MGGCKKLMFLFGGFRLFWGRGLVTLLLFLYVLEEVGRKYVWDMPWPLAAECNMITNKETVSSRRWNPEFLANFPGIQ